MSAPFDLVVKYAGKQYTIANLKEGDTIGSLKSCIQECTGVLPERQKLLGLKHNGKPPGNDVWLSELKLKPGSKIMMVGSKEEAIADAQELPPPEADDVVNDLDIEEEEISTENREEFLQKVAKRVSDIKINVLNEPRPGWKLLVLDIDYTIFDHKSTAQSGQELMRPYLHEFLTCAYEDYDIVIWSATSMKWIEAKMQELSVTNNQNFKISFMLDSAAMITVHTQKYGLVEVKPLGVIWGKFPQYTSKNTIMFDDVRRNFLMNPQNGLKIRPFRQAHLNRDKDRELVYLSQYLKDISELDDFSQLDHGQWEKYRPKKKKKKSEDQHDENFDDDQKDVLS